MIWKLPHREVAFPRRPLVMGIVNVNDDSFSGDGTLVMDEALAQAKHQIEEGADVIDIGAESARTNRVAITIAEEIRRFETFLAGWQSLIATCGPKDLAQVWPPVLSANTWRPEVAEAVLPLGVELLNDMGGLPEAANAELCAQHSASLLIMHSVGQPKVPHLHQQWPDVLGSMLAFFEEKIELAVRSGLSREALILDPGIDFAKQLGDNLTVMNQLERLSIFERPVMVPVSRKTMIGEVLGLPDPCDRDAGTVACIVAAVKRGAAMVRVHNVPAAYQTVCSLHAIA